MPAINVRLDDDTHELVLLAAASRKQSIARWITEAILAGILRQGARRGQDGVALAAELDRRAGAKKGAK